MGFFSEVSKLKEICCWDMWGKHTNITEAHMVCSLVNHLHHSGILSHWSFQLQCNDIKNLCIGGNFRNNNKQDQKRGHTPVFAVISDWHYGCNENCKVAVHIKLNHHYFYIAKAEIDQKAVIMHDSFILRVNFVYFACKIEVLCNFYIRKINLHV